MIASIENGQIVENTSAESIAHASAKKSNSTVDKDQFLTASGSTDEISGSA